MCFVGVEYVCVSYVVCDSVLCVRVVYVCSCKAAVSILCNAPVDNKPLLKVIIM